MEDGREGWGEEGDGSIRIWFFGWMGMISFKEWKSHFKTLMEVKRQRNPTFNPWWAFELLFQHLEHETLETYKSWLN
jgi:hypothetical protein